MLLPYPSFLGEDHNRKVRAASSDPGVAHACQDALRPDPVYMGLRHLVAIGPIGALLRRIERWLEAREHRRYGLSIEEGLTRSASAHLPLTTRSRQPQPSPVTAGPRSAWPRAG